MIKHKMFKRIHNYKKQGYLQSEIVKKTELDPETVKKYYSMTPEDYAEYIRKRKELKSVFRPYTNDILDIYAKNGNKKLNMTSVYDCLEEEFKELPGTEKTLRNYINYLIDTKAIVYKKKGRIYIAVEDLPLGKQMQLDFGEWKDPGGMKVYIMAAVLSGSRYKYSISQDRPFTTSDLIEHLLSCFDYFCGIPEQIVIDQDSLMVVSENHGDIIYTNKFGQFKEEQNLNMFVCRKSDPESKGKIEAVIKYVKNNFLSTRTFSDIDELNERMHNWLRRRANGKICSSTRRVPSELFEEEKKHLKPVRISIFRKNHVHEREVRLIDKNHEILVEGKPYSMPVSYNQKHIDIYHTADTIFLFDHKTGDEIGSLNKTEDNGIQKRRQERKEKRELKKSELKSELFDWFDHPDWQLFIDQNFEIYPRYFRDQYYYARKHFPQDLNTEVFHKAILYCISNNTFSMLDLYDTYSFFISENTNDEHFPVPAAMEVKKKNGLYPGIDVSMREISIYKEIATMDREVAL